MTRDELIERLTWIANAKPGQPMPDWLGGNTNNWGPPLSDLARRTIDTIKRLENEIKKVKRSPDHE